MRLHRSESQDNASFHANYNSSSLHDKIQRVLSAEDNHKGESEVHLEVLKRVKSRVLSANPDKTSSEPVQQSLTEEGILEYTEVQSAIECKNIK